MKSHNEIRELLIPFVLGQLSEKQASEITRHLVECAECGGEVKRLGTILESARQTQDLSADEQLSKSAKNAILAVAEEAEKTAPRPTVSTQNVWRTIIKSRIMKLAAAAAVILIGLVVFFGNGQATLYAQVVEALENARTIHAVTKNLGNGQWEKNTEVWYEHGKGIVETSWRDGQKTYIRIDNGQYMWVYRAGDDFAKRSKTIDPMGVARKLLRVDSFRKQAIRDPSEDKVVNGIRYLAYIRSNPENTYRILTWLDEAKRIRGWEKIRLLDTGHWETYRIGEVEYNVQLSPKVFTPSFGEDVEIVKLDTKLDEYFDLDDALFTKEELGLIFAVHELVRCEGDLIFAVSSIRPTDTSRNKVRSSDSAAWNYGSFQFVPSWKRLDEYGRGRSYNRIRLAEIYHAGLQVRWTLFFPQGFEPEGPEECEFEVVMYNDGALAKKRSELGLPTRERFKPIAVLPLPKESIALAEVMDDTYSAIMELEPLVAFDRLSQKLQLVPFTDEEMDAWAQKVPMSPASKKWLSGDKSWRRSHQLPSSEISKEDWTKDRMDDLQQMKNNYRESLQEAKKREQGSR